MVDNVLWQFNTAHFRIVLECDWEDSPDRSWYDDETRENIDSGFWGVYCFAVRVYFDGKEIGNDCLGDSVYEKPSEFAREHLRTNPALIIRDMMQEAREFRARLAYLRAKGYRRQYRQEIAKLGDMRRAMIRHCEMRKAGRRYGAYFPDMIGLAIEEARTHMSKAQSIRIRAAA